MLNRAPTLHRLGIQAFGFSSLAARLCTASLVCAAFNADFDGDQMCYSRPRFRWRRLEARGLMMSLEQRALPAGWRSVDCANTGHVCWFWVFITLRVRRSMAVAKVCFCRHSEFNSVLGTVALSNCRRTVCISSKSIHSTVKPVKKTPKIVQF